MAHALKNPSGAHRWIACAGSVALCESIPQPASAFYADEGTAAHDLAAACLIYHRNAECRLGDEILVGGNAFPVTHEMVESVQFYLDYVRGIDGVVMTEHSLGITHLTGEDGAHGTADAIVLVPGELVIVDLKYGKRLQVDAAYNPQLAMYAHAAMHEFAELGPYDRIRMVIVQPRLIGGAHVSEWTQTVEELETFADVVREAAKRVDLARIAKADGQDIADHLNPGDKQCQFCLAKATCPALTDHVLSTVVDDFVDVTAPIAPRIVVDRTYDNAVLANLLGAVDLIEDWCAAVRAKAHDRLQSGANLPGFKLVRGKQGNRKWEDEKVAEEVLKSLGLKVNDMYDLSLISPTTAEKLAKAKTIGPRQWLKVQPLITRADGKPTVVKADDPRPAINTGAIADDFDSVPSAAAAA